MNVQEASLLDLQLIKPQVFADQRGFFLESFQKKRYETLKIGPFVQDNLSFSKKNVLRGLHLQHTPAQAKLISCIQGEIWDVALDLRKESKTFLGWQGFFLSGENQHQLYIPEGFAHGFCVLSESAHVFYKVTALYEPKGEISLRWDDPEIGIDWPIQNPILSSKDMNNLSLKEALLALDHRK